MLKELRSRGPILVDFNAGMEFQTYKSGILSEPTPVSMFGSRTTPALAQLYSDEYCEENLYAQGCHTRNTNTATQEDQGLQWTHLTHSTLLIGYGVEMVNGEEQKYWLIRNSYGPNWGLNGNLKLRRGRNDFACESENIAMTPVIY